MGMCRACAASAPVCAATFLVLEKCDTSRLVALHLIVAIASGVAIAPRAPGTRHEHGAEGEGEADARDGGEGARAHAGEFLELVDQVRLVVVVLASLYVTYQNCSKTRLNAVFNGVPLRKIAHISDGIFEEDQ